MTDKILVSVDGAIARVTFNQPEKMNAMSLAMWRGLGDALTRLEADAAVRALILAGAGGKAFVSGADISEFDTARAEADAVAEYDATTREVCERLARFRRPVIAQIDGYCIGGGLLIAAAADIRYCGASSKFAIPAAKLGLGFSYDNAARLTRLVGAAHAKEMVFTARLFSAEEARAMGLVNAVAPDGAVADAAAATAERIAANAPLTIDALKAAVNAAAADPADRDLADVARRVAACSASEDYAEGRRAFAEKRKPVFQGR